MKKYAMVEEMRNDAKLMRISRKVQHRKACMRRKVKERLKRLREDREPKQGET